MRIQDLENRTGLERPSIRFYEREGLLRPKRLENGYRDYSEADIALLLKIKLLRQLGFSIEKIKGLQQGSVDFSVALSDQINNLTSQIDGHKRSRAVCQQIQNDGIDYANLDGAHYLQILKEIPIDGFPSEKKNFQENLPTEIHPWRRFFARTLDFFLLSAVVGFLLFVVLRIRPYPSEPALIFLSIIEGFVFVPIEAWMLHKWGTTPGKLAMGIRLEYIQGGNLPIRDALTRSWLVHKQGEAFRIPILTLIANMWNYCNLTGRAFSRWAKYDEINPPSEMDWDENTEILYSRWEGKQRFFFAGVLAGIILINICIAFDIIKPRYRGSDLTIAQFADNYNATLRFIDEEQHFDRLLPDGTKEPPPTDAAVIYIGGEPETEQQSFAYDTEDGYLRRVTYKNSWNDVFMLNPVNTECVNAAVSLVLAQDNCGVTEFYEFMEIWDNQQKNSIGGFQYKNIEISWDIQYENCEYNDGMLLSISNNEDQGNASVVFQITIQ